MSLRKIYKTDATKEVDGVKLEVGLNDFNGKPIEIVVSRMSRNNQKYQQAFTAKFDPHMTAIQADAMSEELAKKLTRELFVDVILHSVINLPLSDLTGDEADNDKTFEFTRENALALFDELPDLYDDWEGRAKKASNFRAQAVEKAGKNSPKS